MCDANFPAFGTVTGTPTHDSAFGPQTEYGSAVVKPILLLLGSLVLLLLVFLSGVIITANVIAEPEPHRFANINAPDLWTSQPKEVDPARQAYQRLPDAPPSQTAAAESSKPVATAGQPASTTATAAAPTAGQATNAAVDHTMTASVQPSAPISAMMPQPINPNQPTPAPGAAPGSASPSGQQPQTPAVDAAQAQFCYARYRSYRVEDNSYQPFDGGPRRQCQAPGQAPGTPQVEAAAPATREPIARDVAAAPVPAAPSAFDRQTRDRNSQRELPPLPPEAIPTDDEWHAVEPRHGDPRAMESAAPFGSHEAGSHEEWCANRYRSYSADDNSYQPFDGSPRRSCQSPFG